MLVDALGSINRAVSSRGGALPVLSGARLVLDGDQLEVTGSDLDLTIQVTITVAGETDGGAVIPAKLTNEIVRALSPGAVEISVDDETAKITAGRSEFSVQLLSLDDYPRITESDGAVLRLPTADLSEGLKQVVGAASTDDARPILTGVLLSAEESSLRLVATDSYRLALRDLPDPGILEAGQTVLVPSRALGELSRVLGDSDEIELQLGDREIAFTVGSEVTGKVVKVRTRLIEGDFPNYQQLIPSDFPNQLSLSRDLLMDAVRRVKLLARESTPVRLVQSEGELELVAITQDVGEARESLEATYTGEDLTLAFNPDYLMSGLEAMASEEVVLESRDAERPALLHVEGDKNFLYVLMPVRVR